MIIAESSKGKHQPGEVSEIAFRADSSFDELCIHETSMRCNLGQFLYVLELAPRKIK